MNVCGILGGTFDPVHLGHIALAEAALAGLPLAEVLWLPSGSPGHRASPLAAAHDRLAMLRLAIGRNPRYRIDASELDRSEPTYTVHTLARLRAELGRAQPLALLLGSDSFLSLPTWLRWRELFDLAHIAVAGRPTGGERRGRHRFLRHATHGHFRLGRARWPRLRARYAQFASRRGSRLY